MKLMSLIFLSLASLSFTANAENIEPTPTPEESGFIQTSTGQMLKYIAKGERSKPLMLFIHGAPERAEIWLDYLQEFSSDYFAVAYTTRGYYPSSIPSDVSDYTTTALAADAMAVAEHLGYSEFVVVGHDWGGATAWRIALNYPDAVKGLVALSTPHPINYARAYHESEHHKALLDAYIPLAREDIAPYTREATLANDVAFFKNEIYSAADRGSMPWSLGLALEETWEFQDGASIEAIYNHYKALDWPLTTLNTCNPAPWISLTVHSPVLMLYGDKDQFVSPEAFDLENNDCHTNAWTIKLEGAGHFLTHTHKDKVIEKMNDFLWSYGL